MKKFNILLIGILLLTAGSYARKCNHDKMIHPKPVVGMHHDDPSGSRRLLADWDTFRIKADYSNLAGLDANYTDVIQNDIMPAAIAQIQAFYQVKQYEKGLTYPNPDNEKNLTCSGVKIPDSVLHGNSLADTDLLLIVKWVDHPSSSSDASAITCATDATTGRAYVGAVFFNKKFLEKDPDSAYLSLLSTAMHELHHVLLFSSDHFKNYYDPTSPDKKLNVHGYRMLDGKNVSAIIHPRIVAEVQAYHNCSTIDFVPMEDEGGVGSANSHWEKKWFGDEFMTADGSKPVSRRTLVLAEVSGWYKANFSMADPMTWGKNRGCAFLTGACITGREVNATAPVKVSGPEFCTGVGDRGCDIDGKGYGYCVAIYDPNTTLPEFRNYLKDGTFAGSNGDDDYTNKCPYFSSYSNSICSNPNTGVSLSIERSGAGSGCFNSILKTKSSNETTQNRGRCFSHECTSLGDGTYSLKIIVGSQNLTCTGGETLNYSDKNYVGQISCPNPTDFCQVHNSCLRNCGGIGTCVKGQCVCPAGKKGPDCLRTA